MVLMDKIMQPQKTKKSKIFALGILHLYSSFYSKMSKKHYSSNNLNKFIFTQTGYEIICVCVFGLGGKNWNWQRWNQTEPKRNQRRLCRGGQELEQKQQR